jgi:hypothetical protein
MSKPLTSLDQNPELDDLMPSGKALAKRVDEACYDAKPLDLQEVLYLKFSRELILRSEDLEAFMRNVEDVKRRLEHDGRQVLREADPVRVRAFRSAGRN